MNRFVTITYLNSGDKKWQPVVKMLVASVMHRSDARVGSIEKRIEKDYGLPAGSVHIRNPDGRNARSDKEVGNLRKDYEKK